MKSRISTSIALVMLVIVMVILPVMATGCGQTTTGKTLKIGFMVPATGGASEKGLPGKMGIIDAVRYINEEKGGVNGYQIDAVVLDSKYDPTTAVSIINDFMAQHCLMFMTHSSTEMSFVRDIANDAGFPGLVCYASQENYRPPEHIYAQTPDYGDDFATFATYYMQHIWNQTGTETGQPNVIVLGLGNPTGQGAQAEAEALKDELGFNLLPFQPHGSTTTDETEMVTRVAGLDPDLIFISSIPRPSALIMQELKQAHLSPEYGVTVAMAHASFTEQVIELAPNSNTVEGVYGVFPTAIWSNNLEGVNKAKEYAAKYNSKYFGSADYLSTWTAVIIISEILKNALDRVGYDALTTGDIADAWKAIEEQGIQKLNLDQDDLGGLQYEATYVPGDNRLDRWLKIYQITSGNIAEVPNVGWLETPVLYQE